MVVSDNPFCILTDEPSQPQPRVRDVRVADRTKVNFSCCEDLVCEPQIESAGHVESSVAAV